MNRIDALFQRLKQRGEKGLFIYLTAGDPNLEMTVKLIRTVEAAGADLVELGVPFSDPMADGPVIQRASQRALQAGTSLKNILQLVTRIRRETELPLVLMGYYNPVLQYGLDRFTTAAAAAGVDGMIIPDLPVEESAFLRDQSDQKGLDLISLAAPTSTAKRLGMIAASTQGFLYCVSLTGVTGARKGLPPHIREFMARVRQQCDKPLAIGFGISNPEQAAKMSQLGDAIIVGSAVVKLVEQYSDDPEQMLKQVADLVRQLKNACNGESTHAKPISETGCSL